jgi:hypothetical protein
MYVVSEYSLCLLLVVTVAALIFTAAVGILLIEQTALFVSQAVRSTIGRSAVSQTSAGNPDSLALQHRFHIFHSNKAAAQ